MRIALTMAVAACSFLAGCDRPPARSDRKPVEFTLNPADRTIAVGMEGINPATKDRTELRVSSRPSTGAPGEWPLASVISTRDRSDNPQLLVRIFDEADGAVRVQVRFTGPKVLTLDRIVFPHISRADRFMLTTVPGDSAYKGFRPAGDNLEIDWPESADGAVRFRAWPHVH